MSVAYRAVQWSGHKRVYDAVAVAGIALFVAVFFTVSKVIHAGDRAASDEILLIRASGACAMVMLHLILCIGPLARLNPVFLPVLYNRRHLGVLTALVAMIHALGVIGYYHGFGVVSPLVSLLESNTNVGSLRAFPFEWLGLAALVILLIMAATSHDFWLKNLSPAVWKRLHMLVYVAYALLVGHVALGSLQADTGWLTPTLTLAGLAVISSLHIAAAGRESRRDKIAGDSDWIDVGAIDEIPESRARTVCAGGERIAVFKHNGAVSAVSNLCAHQGGPLGEGKIIDGCITCPWHGWQYRPEDGRSPPPFKEQIATYPVRITAGRVQVSPRPSPQTGPASPAQRKERAHG